MKFYTIETIIKTDNLTNKHVSRDLEPDRIPAAWASTKEDVDALRRDFDHVEARLISYDVIDQLVCNDPELVEGRVENEEIILEY